MRTKFALQISAFFLLFSASYSQNFLDVKVILEGPFSGTQMLTNLNNFGYLPLSQPYNVSPWNYTGDEQVSGIPNADVVDWVLVELRETQGDATTAYSGNVIFRKAGFLLKSGLIRSVDGNSLLNFNVAVSYNLYVIIYHRNHLSVMSAAPLIPSGSTFSYDFSNSSTAAYGGTLGQKQLVAGIWGMFAGDGNSDGQVSSFDKNLVWYLQVGLSGYKNGDFNLNGQVNNNDKIEKWSINAGKSSQIPGTWYCGSILPFLHTAGSVAPVNKQVNYNTIETNLSGSNKCWIKQNLGADQTAASATDATEASAGWYWQYNKKQGYKHDGVIRTPGTAWISNINEYSFWQASNDPCSQLMGNDWRLPTFTEWNNADIAGSWNGYNQTFASALKIHASGQLRNTDGALQNRGAQGYYWSHTQYNSTDGRNLTLSNSQCIISNESKSKGNTVRCIRDLSATNLAPAIPSVPDPADGAVNIQINTALSWVCSDPDNDPVKFDVYFGSSNPPSLVSAGQTANTYSPGTLSYGTNYFWKIVAVDDHNNSTSAAVWTFTTVQPAFTCGQVLTVTHEAGNIAPVNKTVNYGTVSTSLSGSNKCWITRNLGASQQATAATDNTEASAGWYWQFNLKQGYKHDGTTRTPNTAWISSISQSSNWVQDNDPCFLLLGTGWRLPTASEWTNADANGGWNNYNQAYASVLKLHAAGFLNYQAGLLNSRGSFGYYWSGNQFNSIMGQCLNFNNSLSEMSAIFKPHGFSARCLKD